MELRDKYQFGNIIFNWIMPALAWWLLLAMYFGPLWGIVVYDEVFAKYFILLLFLTTRWIKYQWNRL